MSDIIPTFDQLVDTELAKYDSVIPKVEELKEQYLSLKIESIDDKDNYQIVKDAIRFIVSKRVEIEEKRKELKANSIAFGKAVDARAREITSLITPIEEYLKDEKARIDFEIEEIKRKEEEAKQAKIKQRHQMLVQFANMCLVGNEYIWTNLNDVAHQETLASINLETLNDSEFADFVSKISELDAQQQERYNEIQSKKAEEEKKLAEEKEKLLEAQKQLLEEQEKLKAEQERMKKEMEEMKAARTSTRLQQLYDIGLVSITHINAICYRRKDDYIPLIGYPEVRDSMADEWTSLFGMVSKKARELREEDEKKDKAEIERLQREAAEREQLKAKELAEMQAKLEQERIAGLSDKEKLADYCKRLLEVPTPEIKTIKWKKELKVITTTIVNYLEQ
jgi:DNA repair exonuclease SbcCD ATPase subunit